MCFTCGQDEEVQVNGVVLVVNFINFGLLQAKAFDRNFGRILMATIQVRIHAEWSPLCMYTCLYMYVW